MLRLQYTLYKAKKYINSQSYHSFVSISQSYLFMSQLSILLCDNYLIYFAGVDNESSLPSNLSQRHHTDLRVVIKYRDPITMDLLFIVVLNVGVEVLLMRVLGVCVMVLMMLQLHR